jgi:hypothetical protein
VTEEKRGEGKMNQSGDVGGFSAKYWTVGIFRTHDEGWFGIHICDSKHFPLFANATLDL